MKESPIATAVLGTANLFALVDEPTSYAVLRAALDVGFTAFDTAPSYGHGRSEAALGRMVAGRDDLTVTTKVGLEATPRASRKVRAAKAVARRLPASLQQRIRPPSTFGEGRFAVPTVRASVERSLRRLGRVDVLLLHEVTPADIDDDLLGELERLRQSGDVKALGVATQNVLTGPCLARAGTLLDHANVSLAPDVAPAEASVPVVVGHGALGAGGSALARLARRLESDPAARARWSQVTAGTRFDGSDGLVAALLGRAVGLGVSGVVLTSSRPARLAASRTVVERGDALPTELQAVLEDLLAADIATAAVR